MFEPGNCLFATVTKPCIFFHGDFLINCILHFFQYNRWSLCLKANSQLMRYRTSSLPFKETSIDTLVSCSRGESTLRRRRWWIRELLIWREKIFHQVSRLSLIAEPHPTWVEPPLLDSCNPGLFFESTKIKACKT